MNSEKCNGWTNTATWLALIHIQNDSIKNKFERNCPVYAINELKKSRCYKSIEDFAKKCLSLIDIECEFDYHGDFKKDINWEEIFNYYKYNEKFPDDEGFFLIPNAKELLKLFVAVDNIIHLPEFQIDRDLYIECKTIIESYGYKYSSKKFNKKGANASEDLQKMIDGVEVLSARKQFNFFPTPRPIVELAQELLCHDGESSILEPSCGTGNLVDGLEPFTRAIEINEDCIVELKNKNIEVIGFDFTQTLPIKFKYIIMNPPFQKRQDAEHVFLAFNNWLEDGGVLVAITSTSIITANDKKSKYFQDLYLKYGIYQKIIDAGAFKESGTMVSTAITKFLKTPEKNKFKKQLSLFY